VTIHAQAHSNEPPAHDVRSDTVEPAGRAAPSLITEQEVLLGTAAALHRELAAVPPQPHPANTRYPRRSPSYFESSLNSREGNRL
jgi:hypothetical protein